MTSVSGNLPDDMKPGDSDPAKQQFLVGRLVAEVTIRATCRLNDLDEIRSVIEGTRHMQQQIDAALGTTDDVDCDEIDIRPIEFEPDRGDDET